MFPFSLRSLKKADKNIKMIDNIVNIKFDTVFFYFFFFKTIFSVSNKPRIGDWGVGLIRGRGLI